LNPADLLPRFAHFLARLPLYKQILLGFATSVFLGELIQRRFFPRSGFYAGWQAVFRAIGLFWTTVILSIVYFLSVSLVSAVMKLRGKDPLDRRLDGESSFWQAYEPNPLGPAAAARHQF
jgi:hypothetical protein